MTLLVCHLLIGDNGTNFHEGFTSRALSPSILEDTISVASPTRSAAVSDNEGDDDSNAFEGFDYSSPFTCSAEELLEFEKTLAQKMLKSKKKEALRLKMKELALEKAAQETEKMKVVMEERFRLMKVKEEEDKRKAEEEDRKKKRDALQKCIDEERKEKLDYEAKLAAYQLALEKIQKKTKNLKKKLRDILDLKEKVERGGVKITPEQAEKLSRKQGVEDEICECECEEDKIEATKPVEPVYQYLRDDCDLKEFKLTNEERATDIERRDERKDTISKAGDVSYVSAGEINVENVGAAAEKAFSTIGRLTSEKPQGKQSKSCWEKVPIVSKKNKKGI